MAHRRREVARVDLDSDNDENDLLGNLAARHHVALQPSPDNLSYELLRQTPVSWPPPPTRFIDDKAARLDISRRCYLCPREAYLRDLVMCSGCGPAHKPAHVSCLRNSQYHQSNVGLTGANRPDDMCEEISYVDYVFTRYLLDTTPLRHDLKALHAEDALCTWIGVPYYQYGRKPQIYVWPRLQRILEQGPATSSRRYPSLVSFIGDTGSGKSTLIRAMIQRIRPSETELHSVPVPGLPDDDFRSTSSDIHVYVDPNTRFTNSPTFYADCEGFVGGANPIAREQIASLNQRRTARDHRMNQTESREEKLFKNIEHYNRTARKPPVNLQWGRLVSLPRGAAYPNDPTARRPRGHVDDQTQERIVKRVYPKILYAFSDVICFVTNNPRSSQDFLKRLIEWAKEAYDRILNQRVKPAVIIILNKHLDPDACVRRDLTREMLRDFEQSQTYHELVDLWTQRGRRIQCAKDVLDCYYRSIKVVTIPVYGRRSLPSAAASISTAVQRLYEDIQASTKVIRDQRTSSNTQFDVATLDTYLNNSLRALAKDYRSSLDFHRLAAGVALRPKLFSEHLAAVMANLARTRGLDETNDVGGEQDVADDMARFVGASIAVQLPWGGVEEEMQEQKESLVQEARHGFELYRWRDWRCEAMDRRGKRRCRNYYNLHRKGHQFERPRDRQSIGISVDDVEEHSHVCSWDPDRFHELIWDELKRLKSKRAGMRRLAVLALETEITEVSSQRTCLMCLSHCPTNMLPCQERGHGICEDCLHRFADEVDYNPVLRLTRCPLGCAFTKRSWSIRVKPKTAGPRVLALDGGGGVRGIVELALLNQIEKEANIHIHELFDLVVGTSTGGVVALGVFYQGWSPKDSISTFQKLARSAFSLRMRLGAPVIKSLVQPFCSFRYTSASIEKAMKDQFGETAYLFGSTDGDSKQADWVKVGLVTCLQSQNQAGLVANYSRDPSGNSEEDPLIRAEHQSEDFKVWEAARATTAAPFYFQPFTHHHGTYEDGAMAEINPIRLAVSESKKIWPDCSRPDIVVSIGTGRVVDSAGEPQTQDDPRTEKLISLLPGVIRKQVETSYNTIKSTAACEDAWKDFMQNMLDPQLRPHCHRLNIAMRKGVKMDDVKEMGALNRASKAYLSDKSRAPYLDARFDSLDDHVCAVARRLVASLFCFSRELGDDIPAGHVQGWIFCRVNPGSEDAETLCKSGIRFRLLQESPSPRNMASSRNRAERIMPINFARGRTRFDPQDMVALVTFRVFSGPFRKTIQLHSPEWRGPTEHWEAISGF